MPVWKKEKSFIFVLSLMIGLYVFSPVVIIAEAGPAAVAINPTGSSPVPVGQVASLPVTTRSLGGPASSSIVFYTSLPSSGGVSLVGEDVLWGLTLVVNKTNSSGALPGKTISLEAKDNLNDQVLLFRHLASVPEEAKIIICPFGAGIADALVDFSLKRKACICFPVTGSPDLRKQERTGVFHFRASLRSEVFALVEYAIGIQKCDKLGIFYEDSAWGAQAFGFASEALAAKGLSSKGVGRYPENTVEVMGAVLDVSKQQPAGVLLLGHARAAYNFISQGIRRGLKNCKWFGLGEVVPNQEILAKARGIELFTTSVVPSPFKSNLPIAIEYRADMARYYANKAITQFFFEGYLAGQIIVDVLKKTGGEVAFEEVSRALDSLVNYSLGGFSLNFDPATRSFNKTVWINTGTANDWPSYQLG